MLKSSLKPRTVDGKSSTGEIRLFSYIPLSSQVEHNHNFLKKEKCTTPHAMLVSQRYLLWDFDFEEPESRPRSLDFLLSRLSSSKSLPDRWWEDLRGDSLLL